MAYSVKSPAVDILPPPPTEKMNSTAFRRAPEAFPSSSPLQDLNHTAHAAK
jgi:hypothetical protein